MKKSYCLIGQFWDHKPALTCQLVYSAHDTEALGYRSEPSLFDLVEKRRYIKLSTLLNMEDEKQVDELKFLLDGCDKLEILVDYKPVLASKAHVMFYEHRLCQCVTLLKQLFPTINICLVKEEDKSGFIAD